MLRSKFFILIVAGSLTVAGGGLANAQNRDDRESSLDRSTVRAQVQTRRDARITAPRSASRNAPALRPVDRGYSELRDASLEHVAESSRADIWTDHNIHDPGITAADLLCYSITDLGLRVYCPMPPMSPMIPMTPERPREESQRKPD